MSMQRQNESQKNQGLAGMLQDFLRSHPLQAEGATAPSPAFSRLLASINQYFLYCGLPALDATHNTPPAGFADALMQWLDELGEYDNPFNYGPVKARGILDAEHNRHLAAVYYAMSAYFAAEGLTIRGRYFSAEQPKLRAEDEAGHAPRIWKRVLSDPSNPHSPTMMVEVSHIDFDNKPMICIGGASTLHGNPSAINGMMKCAENLLGGQEVHHKNIQLYCISHPNAHRATIFGHTSQYNAEPQHFVADSTALFVERYVLPYLGLNSDAAADSSVTPPAPRPSLDALKRKLSRINFFGYSYGTVYVQEVCNHLGQALQRAGYSAEDTREALAEVYALLVGVTCRLDGDAKKRKPHGTFSTIYVISPKDRVTTSRIDIEGLLSGRNPEQTQLIRVSEQELAIVTPGARVGHLLSELVHNEQGLPRPAEEEKEPTPGTSHTSGKPATDTPRALRSQELVLLRPVTDPQGHNIHLYTRRFRGEGRFHDPRMVEFAARNMLATRRQHRQSAPDSNPTSHAPHNQEADHRGKEDLVEMLHPIELVDSPHHSAAAGDTHHYLMDIVRWLSGDSPTHEKPLRLN